MSEHRPEHPPLLGPADKAEVAPSAHRREQQVRIGAQDALPQVTKVPTGLDPELVEEHRPYVPVQRERVVELAQRRAGLPHPDQLPGGRHPGVERQ
ncbi:MAG TPA: hypothetical protein VH141_06305 [Pseudonocardia sp.]|jgi:hypothetical protein|nr:hypothetical protein [Pseudonocardia sp.]